ncbi:ABC transporter ATP-binding protein [Vallitalea pronyensis]|nr:oligopeptide/dipeptide ABC transporter ATP-binding protein [Vallitalea pronyensis]
MMMKKEKILEVKNLKKYYTLPKTKLFQQPKTIKAVNDISFDIYAGETFGLVGESGCGKSTTAKLIANLVHKTEGDLLFDGIPVDIKDKQKRNAVTKNIQMIFQDPFGVMNPRKTIGWFLEEPLKIHQSLSRKERRMRVNHMLEEAGFDDTYYKRYPHELSGGQRQRMSILCSLMLNPKFIIADEPVSALDVSVQSSILNLMKDLQVQYGLTYLFISHDLNVVEYMSDRIGVMYLGKIVELAHVEDIYDNPLHPYTKSLMAAIPSIHDRGNPDKAVIAGEINRHQKIGTGCPFYNRCPEALGKCKDIEPIARQLNQNHHVCCHLYD